MGQTSPPTEVKANEEMRQARRRGVKTPASSYETGCGFIQFLSPP